MDYEKKYNEALERAKDYFKANQRIGELEENDMLSDIFPELKESDDEKIRKGLIEYFKDFRLGTFAYLEPKKILAWLEKQKEFVSADFDDVWETADCNELTAPLEKYSKDAIKEMCHAWYDKGIELERRNWLEKQGTPAELSEEEQNRFAKGVLTSCAMSFIDYLDAHKYEGKMCVSNGECEDIENAFHNAMWDKLYRYYCKYIEKQGEQKPAWSEEEKKKLDRIYYILGIAADEHAYSNTCRLIGDKEAIELQDFLRSIAKPEQKSDWSEEDEERIKNILSVLGVQVCWDGATGEKNNPYQKEINWLKSLRPQNTWKPSEEQLYTLENVTHIVGSKYKSCLASLYQELKKLREE